MVRKLKTVNWWQGIAIMYYNGSWNCVCGLFNSSVSSSDCIVSNNIMISSVHVRGKYVKLIDYGYIWGTIQAHDYKDWGKPRKYELWHPVCGPRTRYHLIINYKCYRFRELDCWMLDTPIKKQNIFASLNSAYLTHIDPLQVQPNALSLTLFLWIYNAKHFSIQTNKTSWNKLFLSISVAIVIV